MTYKLTNKQEAEAVDLLLELLRDHVVPHEANVARARRGLYPRSPRTAIEAQRVRESAVRYALRVATEDDLRIARKIAADRSHQTGKNYAKFIDGEYDHAYGVQCVIAGLLYARGELV